MERNNFINTSKAVKELDNIFKEHISTIKEAVGYLKDLGTAYSASIPSKFFTDASKASGIVEKSANASLKLEKALERERLAQIRLQQQREKAFDSYEKKLAKETQLTAKQTQEAERLNNAYNKIALRVKELTAEYNNLAVRKARGEQLSKSEEQRLQRLTTLTNGYNNVLKKVDSDIGKYQRNVGNYASSWDGLTFQVNQLVREIPAAAYGMNVFFGAIGNNLPMFIDEVKKARDENEKLLAQGKQAPSVLSRVTGAFFNWQTALVLGITLLTLYGREISAWIKEMIGASNALDELKSRQDEFNKAQIEGRKEGVKEVETLRQYVRVMQDRSISDERRAIALKELRSLYPFYFKNLTDEQMLNGDISSVISKLNKDLEKRQELYKKTDLNNINKQKLIELEIEEKNTRAIINNTKARIKSALASNVSAQSIASISDSQRKAESRLNNILKERKEIEDQLLRNNENITILKTETIGLEYKETKSKKEAKKATYDYVSALASEYEVRKAYYESEIAFNEKIANDESKSYVDRADAYEKMYDDQIRLSQLMRNEEIRLLKLANAERLAELEKARKEGILKEGEYASQRIEIQKIYANEEAKINKEKEDRDREIYDNRDKRLGEQIKKLWEYRNALIAIDEAEKLRKDNNLEALEGATIRNILNNNKNILDKYQEYEDNKTKIASDANLMRLNEELRFVEQQLKNEDRISNKYESLAKQRIDLIKQIDDEQAKATEKEKKRLLELAKEYKSFTDNFIKQAVPAFGETMKLFSKEFSDMIKKLSSEGKSGKTMAMFGVALQITEAFQEMYNTLNSSSDAYYQRQFEMLEMQRDTQLKFAGESAVAREEIEKQYEKRRRQIELERAKQQQKQAIFNATIDLAQGIMATIAQNGFPKAIPFIALLTALGTAQIATIASTPLPAYAEGTDNHIGGAMLVNDGKGQNYRETIVTPDGKVMKPQGRNVLMNAPKGTKVFTQEQWNKELNSMLKGNNIKPYRDSSLQLTREDLMNIVNSSAKANQQHVDISIDKQGITAMVHRQSMKVKQLNNRLRIKS